MSGGPEPEPAEPLVVVDGLRKSFPGVQALRDARLVLLPGEVHALVGENGAGKSTLIKALAGVHRPDAGEIRIGGAAVDIRSPLESRALGVAVIHQELALVPHLTVSENVFLGRERARFGFVRRQDERRATRDLLARLGSEIDPDARCGSLSVAEQQLVEIARAVGVGARVLVMDEPTAALTDREAERLFAVVAEMTGRGIGVVYVSHRLDEVFRLADRITVMRDGAWVATRRTDGFTRAGLIEAMVGRPLDQEFPKVVATPGAVRLSVRGLARPPRVRGVSFDVRAGEVVGLTGLVGAGRTETARLIFGADRKTAGTVEIDGVPAEIRSPRDAVRRGIALLTEDRKGQGLVLGMGAGANVTLASLGRLARAGVVDRRAEREAFERHRTALQMRVSGPDQPAGTLSGGTQQKVVLAKWLQADASIFILDEPTRGVDVGAKAEIYGLINGLAAAGKAVLLISSELPEVLGMSDRVLVMHEGRIAGELPPSASPEAVMALATGRPTSPLPVPAQP